MYLFLNVFNLICQESRSELGISRCSCVRVRVYVCVCVCVRACACAGVCVHTCALHSYLET